MNFPLHIEMISMGLPIFYFRVSQVEVSLFDVFLSLELVFVLANSADTDEMQHYVDFN